MQIFMASISRRWRTYFDSVLHSVTVTFVLTVDFARMSSVVLNLTLAVTLIFAWGSCWKIQQSDNNVEGLQPSEKSDPRCFSSVANDYDESTTHLENTGGCTCEEAKDDATGSGSM